MTGALGVIGQVASRLLVKIWKQCYTSRKKERLEPKEVRNEVVVGNL